jgi:hypothetical protein
VLLDRQDKRDKILLLLLVRIMQDSDSSFLTCHKKFFLLNVAVSHLMQLKHSAT